jgi:diguanylate cyclase (GGDEF)-like protein/PAS domain S-box-containing protein
MEFQFPPINYLYLVSCVMAVSLVIFSARQTHNFGARLWVAVMVGFALWTGGELAANMGTTLAWQLGFQRLVYLGVICAVTAWLMFAIYYAGQERWLNARVVSMLLVVPVCSVVMVATLDYHNLLYTHEELVLRGDYYVLELEYGVGFWVQIIACSYLYTLTGSWLLLRTSVRRPGVYRGQSVLVGAAALMPVVPNILYVAGVDIAGGFDPTSIFFVISAVLVTLATQKYHFLTLAPVARDLVFDSVNIAVVVANGEHQITDVNPAFCEISGDSLNNLVGRSVNDVFARSFEGIDIDRVDANWQGRLSSSRDQRQFDVTSMPVIGYHREKIGYLILLNDVTLIQKALDEINRLAGTDLLTDLPNRRAMQSWSKPSDTGANDGGQSLMVVADIDHFKDLNDQYGHAAGDKVLAAIAALVRSSIRPTDQLARWGGEEFCLVLNDTSPDAGMAVIERLRHRIEQYRVEHEGVQLGITMTFGVVARQPGESMDDCIARADAAMYEGKRSGRNTVVAAF